MILYQFSNVSFASRDLFKERLHTLAPVALAVFSLRMKVACSRRSKNKIKSSVLSFSLMAVFLLERH